MERELDVPSSSTVHYTNYIALFTSRRMRHTYLLCNRFLYIVTESLIPVAIL